MSNISSRRRPFLTVDIVIIRKDGSFVLIKRKKEPFKDYWAIPGGFVEYGEKVEEAAIREAKEETGLDVELKRIVGVYSDPSRDPRGHVISIAYLAREIGGKMRAGDDAKLIKSFRRIPRKLAFDHREILKEAFRRIKS
jgi:8-oxo-dGTP diphosphatase